MSLSVLTPHPFSPYFTLLMASLPGLEAGKGAAVCEKYGL